MTIADNIKRLRDQYGLTQADLGEIAGVSDKAVWTWENGTATPRMGAVQKLADHFGITKSSIVDEDDAPEYYLDPEVAAKAQEIYQDPDTRILLDAKRDLSQEDLDYVLKTISILKAKENEED